jgi:hypothetical protein
MVVWQSALMFLLFCVLPDLKGVDIRSVSLAKRRRMGSVSVPVSSCGWIRFICEDTSHGVCVSPYFQLRLDPFQLRRDIAWGLCQSLFPAAVGSVSSAKRHRMGSVSVPTSSCGWIHFIWEETSHGECVSPYFQLRLDTFHLRRDIAWGLCQSLFPAAVGSVSFAKRHRMVSVSVPISSCGWITKAKLNKNSFSESDLS